MLIAGALSWKAWTGVQIKSYNLIHIMLLHFSKKKYRREIMDVCNAVSMSYVE